MSTDEAYSRPNMDEYFMGIAMAVRKRANCMGNRVGAVIVKDNHIVSTGYNGTPHHMTNCMEGGCHRCAHRDEYPSGTGYDLCICVHAEQNALLQAARFGIAVEGATMYSTMRPCFGCTKELLQACIHTVYYLHDWAHPNEEYRAEYERLQSHFPGGIRPLLMDDPDEAWAVASRRAAAVAVSREAGDAGR
jgi:dCMP deaminase